METPYQFEAALKLARPQIRTVNCPSGSSQMDRCSRRPSVWPSQKSALQQACSGFQASGFGAGRISESAPDQVMLAVTAFTGSRHSTPRSRQGLLHGSAPKFDTMSSDWVAYGCMYVMRPPSCTNRGTSLRFERQSFAKRSFSVSLRLGFDNCVVVV